MKLSSRRFKGEFALELAVRDCKQSVQWGHRPALQIMARSGFARIVTQAKERPLHGCGMFRPRQVVALLGELPFNVAGQSRC
jgi:hypothetical protein